jgi:hypothetical protein
MRSPLHATAARPPARRRGPLVTIVAAVALCALFGSGGAAGQEVFPMFAEWAAPVNLGAPVNSSEEESGAAISDDGRSLYFNRNPIWPA